MGVIPARSRGTNHKTIALRRVRGNERRTFLRRSVNFGSDKQSVPVDQFWIFAVVEDLNGYPLAFAKPQMRTRNRSVVADGLDDFLWRNLELYGSDMQGGVGLWVSGTERAGERRKKRKPG